LKSTIGIQTATVIVSDQRGADTRSTVEVRVVPCGICDFPCPWLAVTCPASVAPGDIVTFQASITGGDLPEKITYLWSHSNGIRPAGQEGPVLKIQAIGLPGDVIKATVNLLGWDPSCGRQASCESKIVKPVN
jgi:hypothetical protein